MESTTKTIKILSRWDRDRVLYTATEVAGLREAVRKALASGVDLSDADLRDANLRVAYLSDANLSGAYLSDANLGTIRVAGLEVPRIERIHTCVLEAVEKDLARFDMGNWHETVDGLREGLTVEQGEACGTTHCRAGFAIHLAGAQGYALEREVGPACAGALIYAASGVDRIPDFYASTDDALESMREDARREQEETAR